MAETDDILTCCQVDHGVRVTINGDVDLTTSPQLREELLAVLKAKPAKLLIDLSDVGFMDSSGVATLVEALRQQRTGASKLVLYGMQPRVRSIFEISRLDSLFTIVADEQAAQQA